MKKTFYSIVGSMVLLTSFSAYSLDDLAIHKKTVAATKNMGDERFVSVTGVIVERIMGEYYRFRDKTGDMCLEIDSDKLVHFGTRSLPFGAVFHLIRGKQVTITGETDREYFKDGCEKFNVDVSEITVIDKSLNLNKIPSDDLLNQAAVEPTL
ncbi:NirD/YgiW/YdeI family stress tolerance protein [Pigmentibacter sp. JX0631]|uniref:NirD/YgiW/YdeI family stress tolerance protein n=1 Tax=Pigmentibacter sp. JX0631 TaxID=2976982 RepID=UPI0024688AAA|nr:NirD/YgiW/YdeI family stress tolerance protein [Pigmentibacter sp. JX0631]WGL61376.1 NirD/YgiW/YdeI family stress tolerance protein [Pigmentibacter sp. JX0631]